MRYVGRPPQVTLEQYRRIMEVRSARRAIPGNKALARELGINVATIGTTMVRGIKTYDHQLRDGHGRKPTT